MSEIKFKSINKLQGSRVVLFGGTLGIGLAVAAAALEHGASVFVTSSKQAHVDSAISDLKQSYPTEEFYRRIDGAVCDLGSVETLEQNLVQLFERATNGSTDGMERLVDHVVFTAGDLLQVVPLQDSTAESIVKSGTVRFLAPLIIGKLAPRYLRISNRSSITITAGSMARRPDKGWSVLAAFASGQEGMRLGMGKDLAPIRVNVVSPGVVQTPLLSRLSEEDKRRWQDVLLTGELGWPEDVAEAYIYSMKDRSATGALIDSSDGRIFN
ncbi:dehydrogenase with different specificitie [Penicillium cosmopolitanum]|uniref:Dehydrogenase with different specificitie n=1 Tax=Penicillium cosmopolitanum TaxID=1131564 RepID=A0A9X0BBZ2_9EURO|nr:dehydrogenase with different specificitie [Penicillium cosmopolitanum]KAJ5404068.1 dehydrogenase with different specificitie [Penicillium cosmopolitanum]